MSIQPIDIQIIFAHLDQVAKSMHLPAAAQEQSLLGSKIAAQSLEEKNDVNKSQKLPKEGNTIQEFSSGQGSATFSEKEEKESEEKESHPTIKDPQLGKRIDLQT